MADEETIAQRHQQQTGLLSFCILFPSFPCWLAQITTITTHLCLDKQVLCLEAGQRADGGDEVLDGLGRRVPRGREVRDGQLAQPGLAQRDALVRGHVGEGLVGLGLRGGGGHGGDSRGGSGGGGSGGAGTSRSGLLLLVVPLAGGLFVALVERDGGIRELGHSLRAGASVYLPSNPHTSTGHEIMGIEDAVDRRDGGGGSEPRCDGLLVLLVDIRAGKDERKEVEMGKGDRDIGGRGRRRRELAGLKRLDDLGDGGLDAGISSQGADDLGLQSRVPDACIEQDPEHGQVLVQQGAGLGGQREIQTRVGHSIAAAHGLDALEGEGGAHFFEGGAKCSCRGNWCDQNLSLEETQLPQFELRCESGCDVRNRAFQDSDRQTHNQGWIGRVAVVVDFCCSDLDRLRDCRASTKRAGEPLRLPRSIQQRTPQQSQRQRCSSIRA